MKAATITYCSGLPESIPSGMPVITTLFGPTISATLVSMSDGGGSGPPPP